MLHNFYIFNRKGRCLFYKEWDRPLNTMADDPEEERKLVFGMLFSLKDMTSKLSPDKEGNDNLHFVKTNAFTLHHYQSPSGLMFVLNTNNNVPDMYTHLQHVYSQLYVECIARNPLYRHKPDEPFKSVLFVDRLEEYLFSLVQAR
ncbi:Sybindin-like protein [Ochromonadaceae sp. CCMP2298]|nr:Sybindin-like protein [Ochromonadaceae sp. CCMP2298]